jgi:bifunctional DNase/RNase
MELIPCEMNRIIINEANDQQVIFLKEKGKERNFPIVIGMYEAWIINNTIKGISAPRPLTHDLIVNVINGLGAKLNRIIVTKLEEGIYYAILEAQRQGEVFEIDARPSDAIAISLKMDIPIFVSKDVFDQVV